MDGYEDTLAIRSLEDETKKNIAILADVTDVTEHISKRCTEIGVNDYISKPMIQVGLRQKIETLVFKSL